MEFLVSLQDQQGFALRITALEAKFPWPPPRRSLQDRNLGQCNLPLLPPSEVRTQFDRLGNHTMKPGPLSTAIRRARAVTLSARSSVNRPYPYTTPHIIRFPTPTNPSLPLADVSPQSAGNPWVCPFWHWNPLLRRWWRKPGALIGNPVSHRPRFERAVFLKKKKLTKKNK